MKTLCHFSIKLTLRGPVLTKSTSPSSFGLDAAVARDFGTNQPILPGTLIKGKIREALCQLGESNLNELFGKRTDGEDTEEDRHHKPYRGGLIVEDLIAETAKPAEEAARLHRVALEPTLGSAKGQMLRVLEAPFLAREDMVFSGIARRYCEDGNNGDVQETERLLRLGLNWLTQVGAGRTTGFGRLLQVEVNVVPRAPRNRITVLTAGPSALELAIRPRGPLCISQHKIGGNLFESGDIVPGNLLAGAIMQTAVSLGIADRLAPPLFNLIRFRHAFPTTGNNRPRTLPLSTVKAGTLIYDIAHFRDPVLLTDDAGQLRAPAFPLDWKKHEDALRPLDWARPVRELRVRTAIDAVHRTANRGVEQEGGQLFAWEMAHPVTDKKKEIVWRTRIDLNRLASDADRLAAANTLAEVLSHLGFVSKTKAFCHVDVIPVAEPPAATVPANGQPLALVLQTPALLADPRFQTIPTVSAKDGALSAVDQFRLYQDVWDKRSNRSLRLTHYFAQQFLAGGNYMARRFQTSNPYNPWLLTAAGSVFVFTVADQAEAATRLDEWLKTGLTLPDEIKTQFGDAWNQNPYIPENGFGEIAVHSPEFLVPSAPSITLADPILPPL